MDHDEASEVLKRAFEEILSKGFPKEEMPVLLADWSTLWAVAAAGAPGGFAIAARIRRQTEEMSDGRHGQEAQQRAKRMLAGTSPTASFAQSLDATPMRIAMEHLLSHQAIPLDQAAACFVIFALGLVFDHMGSARVGALVNTAGLELERLAMQAGLGSSRKGPNRVN